MSTTHSHQSSDVHNRALLAREPGYEWGRPSPPSTAPTVSMTTHQPSTIQSNTATTLATTVATTSTATASQPSSTSTGGGMSSSLTSDDANRLTSLGFQATGTNAKDSSGGVWIGSGGPYTSSFTNSYSSGIILVVWGPGASWVNAHTPLITVSLPPQRSTTISFAYQQSGAWSAVYPDTILVNGQISNTWAEFTFTSSGVVDISRLVNGNGRSLEVVGPSCTSNMSTCVFRCNSGTTCMTGYKLVGCASQSGAQVGTDSNGADSGGCGWNGATTGSFKTTFGA